MPVALQEQIAAEVGKLGNLHVFNLQCCSKLWRLHCSKELSFARVSADQLSDTMPILNSMKRLQNLEVTCSTLPLSLAGNALSSLNASLKALSLNYGSCTKLTRPPIDLFLIAGSKWDIYRVEESREREEEEEFAQTRLLWQKADSTLIVQNLKELLQPWNQSLEHLHLEHCQSISCESSRSWGPGDFSEFPRLRTLHLISMSASSASWKKLNLTGCTALKMVDCSGSGFWSLYLDGCNALEVVNCQRNSIIDLELSNCNSLVSLDCCHNQLKELDLSSCPLLTRLFCSANELVYVILATSSCLHTLSCAGISQCPNIEGGALCFDLRCNANQLTWDKGLQRQHLVRLSLKYSCVTTTVTGFKDLQYLSCKFRHGDSGVVDLTGCTSVELDCMCEQSHLPILAGSTVPKLTLHQLGRSQPDLCGFTTLQELRLILYKQASLKLSGCWVLKKATLAAICGQVCPLASVDLSQCPLLEELHCDGFQSLKYLDVSPCSRLTSLTCMNSSLLSIDTSACPLLTTLHVSHLLKLRSIRTSKCNHLLRIIAAGCGKLQVNEEASTGHHVIHCWDVVAPSLHSVAPEPDQTETIFTKSLEDMKCNTWRWLSCLPV